MPFVKSTALGWTTTLALPLLSAVASPTLLPSKFKKLHFAPLAETSAVALETRDVGIPACAGMTEDLEAPFDRLRVSGSEERDRLRLAEAVAGALTTVLNVTPSVA